MRTPEQIAARKKYDWKRNYGTAARPKTLEQRRVSWLKRNYAITPTDYDRMLKSQGGLCAICKTPEPRGRAKRFHVDHDHVSKQIRGLLCNRCNTGIGLLGDTVDGVLRAVGYLARTA